MKRLKRMSIAALLLTGIASAAMAGEFDGTTPMLCSVVKVIEYTPEDGCHEVTPESIALPRFLNVAVQEKKIMSAGESDGKRSSDIKHMERVGGKLILQGADEGIRDVRDGAGWTAAVSEETGAFVLTAAGDDVAFVVYGACTSLP